MTSPDPRDRRAYRGTPSAAGGTYRQALGEATYRTMIGAFTEEERKR